MNFTDAIRSGFSKYATFSGRAARSEFWYFALFVLLGGFASNILDSMLMGRHAMDSGPLNGLFSLATIIPSIAVAVRRLHDTDRTGWWYLLVFIPIVGWIILLIWYATVGTDGPNQYGEDPLNGAPADPAAIQATHESGIPKVDRSDD